MRRGWNPDISLQSKTFFIEFDQLLENLLILLYSIDSNLLLYIWSHLLDFAMLQLESNYLLWVCTLYVCQYYKKNWLVLINCGYLFDKLWPQCLCFRFNGSLSMNPSLSPRAISLPENLFLNYHHCCIIGLGIWACYGEYQEWWWG